MEESTQGDSNQKRVTPDQSPSTFERERQVRLTKVTAYEKQESSTPCASLAVRDDNQRPVVGCEVRFRWTQSGTQGCQRERTDKQGCVSLTEAPLGTIVEIHTQHPDYSPAFAVWDTATPLQITLKAPLIWRGRVQNLVNGESVSDATVTPFLWDGLYQGPALEAQRTNAAGEFSLRIPMDSKVRLIVEHEDFRTEQEYLPALVGKEESEACFLNFRMTPMRHGASVPWNIVGPKGQRLSTPPTLSRTPSQPRERRIKTHASSPLCEAFPRLTGRGSKRFVDSHAIVWHETGSGVIRFPKDSGITESLTASTLTLKPTSRVDLRLKSPQGLPLTDAVELKLEWQFLDREQGYADCRDNPYDPLEIIEFVSLEDEHGRLEIDLPGSWNRLRVSMESPLWFGEPFLVHRQELRDEELAHRTWVLESLEQPIHIQVCDLQNKPLKSSLIKFFPKDKSRWFAAYSDEHGHYSAPVNVQDYVLEVSAPDHVGVKFDIAANELDQDITVHLDQGGFVEGRVLDEDRRPVASMMVRANWYQPRPDGSLNPRAAELELTASGRVWIDGAERDAFVSSSSLAGSVDRIFRTDENGRFRIDGIPAFGAVQPVVVMEKHLQPDQKIYPVGTRDAELRAYRTTPIRFRFPHLPSGGFDEVKIACRKLDRDEDVFGDHWRKFYLERHYVTSEVLHRLPQGTYEISWSLNGVEGLGAQGLYVGTELTEIEVF